jgi:hypothetical protein
MADLLPDFEWPFMRRRRKGSNKRVAEIAVGLFNSSDITTTATVAVLEL